MHTCLISTEAKYDIAAAVLYYERISENSKNRFVNALENCFDSIMRSPNAYGFRHENVRAANVKKFKYIVYFFVDEPSKTIRIFAVLHGTQNPTRWIGRLG